MTAKSRNLRGNSYRRYLRRLWLTKTFGVRSAKDKILLYCHHCNKRLYSKWQVDRFPICGHKGGRYIHGNIVPSCTRCNQTRCKYPGCYRTR